MLHDVCMGMVVLADVVHGDVPGCCLHGHGLACCLHRNGAGCYLQGFGCRLLYMVMLAWPAAPVLPNT